MRVALIHPFMWPEVRRGAERYLDDLAWYLVGRGHDVHIVTSTTEPSSVQTEAAGVVVHRCRQRGLRWFSRLRIGRVEAFGAAVLPTLVRDRFDVAHAMVPSAAVAAGLARIPTLFTFIGHPTAAQLDDLGALDRLLYGLVARRAPAIAALSQASARSVGSLFGRAPLVLPPGVRTADFPCRDDPRTGPPRILFSATPADRRKRLDVALSAMDRVLDIHPDARLQISGSGDASWALARLPPDRRDRLAAATDQLGPGTPEDLPARYRQASVVVLPAVDEAFGIALIESLASGTPVVAGDDAGMVDIVDDDRIGRTFAAEDAQACAHMLVEAIELATRRSTPAACAAHAARWDWAVVGRRHEAQYESLMQGDRAPGRR